MLKEHLILTDPSRIQQPLMSVLTFHSHIIIFRVSKNRPSLLDRIFIIGHINWATEAIPKISCLKMIFV